MVDRGTVCVDIAATFVPTAPRGVDTDDPGAQSRFPHHLAQRADAASQIAADFGEPARVGELRDRLLLQTPPLKPTRNVAPTPDGIVEVTGSRPAGRRIHAQPLHHNAGLQTLRRVDMVTTQSPLRAVRDALGSSLFEMIAGPDGPAQRERIHDTPGPRWFADDSPIRRVHGDASMFVGGLRALLLQSLHPLAMAGVAEHSNYREDPWGRLQRTSTFLAETTFGSAVDAQRAVDRVRGIHRYVHGVAADGRAYTATDPHLLEWVHVAEADSFSTGPPALRRRPAGPGRPRRIRRRHGRDRRQARRDRPAAHRT